jgi:ribosomal-protein-alanine N-acetyltransferase
MAAAQGESLTMLTGTKVRLRAFHTSDRDAFDRIESDPEARQLLEDGIPFPPTARDSDAFLDKVSANGPIFLFAVERLEDGVFIGTIAGFKVNWKNRHITVGISLDRSVWGQGCGTDAMKILVGVIFTEMNLHKVKLNVIANNPRAIRSYEKVGFQVDGHLRDDIFRAGKYFDLIEMSLLRRDWLAAQGG